MERDICIFNEKEKCNIHAKIFYNKSNEKSEEIFIFCHGFCSGKGSNSVKVVANMLLENGINSISFDFPGHIDSEQGTEKLNVEVCCSYLNTIIKYVKQQYGENVKISFYAISFGAYILLNKLIGDNNEYKNIVLRSPAINMKEIFTKCLLKEDLEQYKRNGKAKCGHNGMMEIPYSFLEDLEKHNLYVQYKEKRKILIIHGMLDDTAPIQDTYKFIKDNPEIKLIEVKNAKHHMEPNEIKEVTEMMLKELKINN